MRYEAVISGDDFIQDVIISAGSVDHAIQNGKKELMKKAKINRSVLIMGIAGEEGDGKCLGEWNENEQNEK